jgi:hypothetical protein
MGIKRCGVLKNGVACQVLISEAKSLCVDCAADLMEELERLAGPAQPALSVVEGARVKSDVPRGTLRETEAR